MVREEMWRSGLICFVLFEVILCFNLLSQPLLILLSLSRLMVVISPMETKFKSTIFILECISCIYWSTFILGCSLTLLAGFRLDELPMNLCLPFVDPTLSSFIENCNTIGSNNQFITSTVISIQHIRLVYYVIMFKKKFRGLKSKSSSENKFITQLVVITLSNITCWIPTDIIYIVGMYIPKYSFNLVIWTTVFLMPINSANIHGKKEMTNSPSK